MAGGALEGKIIFSSIGRFEFSSKWLGQACVGRQAYAYTSSGLRRVVVVVVVVVVVMEWPSDGASGSRGRSYG